MDNVQKNAITDDNAPSSKPFRLHCDQVFLRERQIKLQILRIS
jgi:hypothetical protein